MFFLQELLYHTFLFWHPMEQNFSLLALGIGSSIRLPLYGAAIDAICAGFPHPVKGTVSFFSSPLTYPAFLTVLKAAFRAMRSALSALVRIKFCLRLMPASFLSALLSEYSSYPSNAADL